MVRQTRKIIVFLLLLSSVTTYAKLPVMVTDAIRWGMESYAQYVEKGLVKQADEPKKVEQVLHYLFLKNWLNHYRNALNNPERTERELKNLEETIELPEPGSNDARLIAQSIYLRQMLPDAVAARTLEIESRKRDPYAVSDEYSLERSMRVMTELLRDLRRLEEGYAYSQSYREGELERLSKLISAQYEEIILNVAQLEPSILEVTVVGVAASIAEAAIMVATLAFVGNQFKGPEVFAATTIAGMLVKVFHAVCRADARFLIPFWGVVDRTHTWTQSVRSLGLFPSQWFARRNAAISAPLSSEDSSTAQSRHRNECGEQLVAMAYYKAQTVPFYKVGERLKHLNLPAGVR